MREVVMTTDEFREIPGHSTRKSVSSLKGMVDALLTEHGVRNKAWITREGEDELLFELEVEVQGVQRTLAFRFQPPRIVVKKRRTGGYSPWVHEPKPAASWRVFHDLLQRTLAAAKLGIMPVHHVLMAFISKQLPDGTPGTFGDFMDLVIADDKMDQLALEDRREAKVVEAEVVERGR